MAVDYSGMVEDLKDDLKKASEKNKRSEEQAKKTSELKRCAFCGGEARIEAESIGKEKYLYSVSCINDCVTQGIYHKSVDSAIKAWNNRKPLDRVIERLEERIRILDNTSDINYPSVDVAIKETKRIIEIIKEEMM